MEQNLSLYYVFHTVAKKGSISHAAKELYISQPAISKSIQKLEDNLNTTLFKRSSRGVTLTADGEILFQHTRDAFAALEEGEEILARHHALGVDQLRIGVSTTLCKYILLPHLQRFIKAYPHVKISISCQSTYQTLTLLEENKIDFEKVNTESEIKAQIQDLVKRRIITEKESQVLSPRKIMRFFKSPIAKRMLSSKFVKREQKIYTQIKMNDIYLNDEIFKNNRETYENESVMLRGVIDLYFEEDDGLVILDYKTDFVDKNNKKEIIHKYKKQIEIYADVLSKLTGKKVKEKYLYLFGIDEQVKVD